MESEQKAKSGSPEYMSHRDWSNRLKGRRVKVLRFAGGVLAAVFIAFAAYGFVGVGRAYMAREAILGSLSQVHNYRLTIITKSPDGTTSEWRTDSRIGEDWQMSLWSGALVFTKHGNDYFTDDRYGAWTKKSNRWVGSRPLVQQAIEAAEQLDPWRFNRRQGRVDIGADSRGNCVYTFCAFDTKWSIVVDGSNDLVQMTEVGDRMDRWADTIVASVSESGSEAHFDPFGGYPAPGEESPIHSTMYGPNGPAGEVTLADVNANGDMFFKVSDARILQTRDVVRDGDRYYNCVALFPSSDREGLRTTDVRLASLSDPNPRWPLVLNLRLSLQDITPGGKGEVFTSRLTYTFKHPTCAVLPAYSSDGASDAVYYQHLSNSAKLRADYDERVVYTKDGPQYSFFKTDPHPGRESDQEEAVRQDLLSVLYDHQVYPTTAATGDLLYSWMDCDDHLRFIDHGSDAVQAYHNALYSLPSTFPAGTTENQLHAIALGRSR